MRLCHNCTKRPEGPGDLLQVKSLYANLRPLQLPPQKAAFWVSRRAGASYRLRFAVFPHYVRGLNERPETAELDADGRAARELRL